MLILFRISPVNFPIYQPLLSKIQSTVSIIIFFCIYYCIHLNSVARSFISAHDSPVQFLLTKIISLLTAHCFYTAIIKAIGIFSIIIQIDALIFHTYCEVSYFIFVNC